MELNNFIKEKTKYKELITDDLLGNIRMSIYPEFGSVMRYLYYKEDVIKYVTFGVGGNLLEECGIDTSKVDETIKRFEELGLCDYRHGRYWVEINEEFEEDFRNYGSIRSDEDIKGRKLLTVSLEVDVNDADYVSEVSQYHGSEVNVSLIQEIKYLRNNVLRRFGKLREYEYGVNGIENELIFDFYIPSTYGEPAHTLNKLDVYVNDKYGNNIKFVLD